MICSTHSWDKKTHPCPWVYCENGVRAHTFVRGKTTYARVRIKDSLGPRYEWHKVEETRITAERSGWRS